MFWIIGYVLFFALPLGGTIGGITGRIMRKLLKESKDYFLFDVFLGGVGVIVGTYIVSLDFSLKQKWMDGQIVYKKISGLGAYYYIILPLGAIILVALFHLILRLYKKSVSAEMTLNKQ